MSCHTCHTCPPLTPTDWSGGGCVWQVPAGPHSLQSHTASTRLASQARPPHNMCNMPPHATTCQDMSGHVRTGFPVLQLTRNLQLTHPLSLSLSIDSPKEVCGLDPLLSMAEVFPLWSCDNNYKLRLGRNLLRIRKLVQREKRERERERESERERGASRSVFTLHTPANPPTQ